MGKAIGSCAIWILCFGFNSGFVISFGYLLRRNEKSLQDPNRVVGGPQDDTTQFFYPRSCWPRDGQKIEACHGDGNLNQTMCSKFNCCYTLEQKQKMTCYAPLVDNIQLTLRFFIIGITCLIFLGCVPICCCILCQKNKLTNNLQRENPEVTKILLNHNDTLENIDDAIERLIQEDERRKMSEKKKNQKGRCIH
ncbi:fmr1 neighbor protein-like [Notamacropus eugenii]|uniref:fmr1 neighbor protein-like n=1 Tax=Notamacropus eugenii TaxID=9315 RepID=UPI003B6746B0